MFQTPPPPSFRRRARGRFAAACPRKTHARPALRGRTVPRRRALVRTPRPLLTIRYCGFRFYRSGGRFAAAADPFQRQLKSACHSKGRAGPLRRPAESLRPKALRAFRFAPDKHEKTDKPEKHKKQDQAPEETALTAEKMSYLLGTHVSLAEKDHQRVTKTQEVTNHNHLTFLPTPAIWSFILVMFNVAHMFAHSSFKCESKCKCKCKIKCTSQVSKSVSIGIIIAMSIVLMLIIFSTVIVIKTGPDSPGYYACVLLRSRQRDYGSPLHPSGGYTAPHAAPLLRAPR